VDTVDGSFGVMTFPDGFVLFTQEKPTALDGLYLYEPSHGLFRKQDTTFKLTPYAADGMTLGLSLGVITKKDEVGRNKEFRVVKTTEAYRAFQRRTLRVPTVELEIREV